MRTLASTVVAGRSHSVASVRHFPDLVDALGTADFEERMISVARTLLPHEHIGCHVFQMPPGQQARFAAPLFARSYDGRDTVRISSSNYLQHWWREDPDILALGSSAATNRAWASRLMTCDVESVGYVEGCAIPSEVSERVALTYRSGVRFVSLRFYRSRRHRPLSVSQLEDIGALSELLGALCMKQAQLQESAKASLLARLCAQADARGAGLSIRERQVIEGIVGGKAMADIATMLGVAETSAVTFRQRAYAKLGIARRSDLFRSAQ